MSLCITINGPNGIVIASESRISVNHRNEDDILIPTTFDNTDKLISFLPFQKYIGCSFCGLLSIENRQLSDVIDDFKETIPDYRISVSEIAERLSSYLMDKWKKSPISSWIESKYLIQIGVCGYDVDSLRGKLFEIVIPVAPEPKEYLLGNHCICMMGQTEIVEQLIWGCPNRLKQGLLNLFGQDKEDTIQIILNDCKYQLNLEIMSLQDYINFAMFLIETTIRAQSFSTQLRGCGGPIDVATITRKAGFSFIHHKGMG